MNRRVWLDWYVFTKKLPLMQRMADLVRTGHHWYVSGQVLPSRAGYLAGKFDGMYRVGLTRLEQSRRRKRGLPSCRLLMLHMDDDERLYWWLLRTDRTAPLDGDHERWRNALEDSINFSALELVRHTRAGAKSPSWTWRYSADTERYLMDSLICAIRGRNDDDLQTLIYTIWGSPGFGGIRDQAERMRELIVGEWGRSRGREPLPDLPQRLRYVRRLQNVGMKLSELIENLGVQRG